MGIDFKKVKTETRFKNPLKNFALEEIPLEIRFDPLTGQTGRVFDLPYSLPEPPSETEIIERSKGAFCPFCPEVIEKSTPLFPKQVIPEGRIRVGEAWLIPNLLPLDKYVGVTILSRDHYIAMENLTWERMKDAFLAALKFIKRVAEVDPSVNFFYVNWNYMPEAGSSILHPHIQVNCGEVPTNYHRAQIEGAKRYSDETGSNFWLDYIETERDLGERYIAEIGSTFWAMSYVSQSHLPDVWSIFPEHDSMTDITEEDLDGFLKGLECTLKYFITQHIPSFNVAIFSVREDENFRVNAKICPRHVLRPVGNSDQTYFQTLHKEPSTIRPPEKVCGKIQEFFR